MSVLNARSTVSLENNSRKLLSMHTGVGWCGVELVRIHIYTDTHSSSNCTPATAGGLARGSSPRLAYGRLRLRL